MLYIWGNFSIKFKQCMQSGHNFTNNDWLKASFIFKKAHFGETRAFQPHFYAKPNNKFTQTRLMSVWDLPNYHTGSDTRLVKIWWINLVTNPCLSYLANTLCQFGEINPYILSGDQDYNLVITGSIWWTMDQSGEWQI